MVAPALYCQKTVPASGLHEAAIMGSVAAPYALLERYGKVVVSPRNRRANLRLTHGSEQLASSIDKSAAELLEDSHGAQVTQLRAAKHKEVPAQEPRWGKSQITARTRGR
ncbi:hypothetical protein CRG98_029298 [Punica granatum]|uniref:Uncharacterized protein n=1 Tax=Punica granatum TaxID=22663 RepID=A0A2I0J1X3_PUNGR|nr:hypothetical protein CRG98_029298 [Punica granatum]